MSSGRTTAPEVVSGWGRTHCRLGGDRHTHARARAHTHIVSIARCMLHEDSTHPHLPILEGEVHGDGGDELAAVLAIIGRGKRQLKCSFNPWKFSRAHQGARGAVVDAWPQLIHHPAVGVFKDTNLSRQTCWSPAMEDRQKVEKETRASDVSGKSTLVLMKRPRGYICPG